jgi:hypothetical protein
VPPAPAVARAEDPPAVAGPATETARPEPPAVRIVEREAPRPPSPPDPVAERQAPDRPSGPDAQPPEPVEVHIGTIEVQVAAPPEHVAPPPPAGPAGFDDYGAIR